MSKPKFVTLTIIYENPLESRKLYQNAAHIDSMFLTRSGKGTLIYLINPMKVDPILVQETPEEIIAQINAI